MRWVLHRWLQPARYAVVGGTSLALNVGVTYMLVEEFRVGYLLASWVGGIASTIFNFGAHKFFTFLNSTGLTFQVAQYGALKTWNWCIGSLALLFLVEEVGLRYTHAQIGILICIGIQNFLVLRFLIFRFR